MKLRVPERKAVQRAVNGVAKPFVEAARLKIERVETGVQTREAKR